MPACFLLAYDCQFSESLQSWQMTKHDMAVKLEKSAKWPSSSIFICEFRYFISDCPGGPPKNSFILVYLTKHLKRYSLLQEMCILTVPAITLSVCLFSSGLWSPILRKFTNLTNEKCHGC